MPCIGIDVAKRSHVAAAMGDGGEVAVEPFEFRNTQKGFERLLERLARRGVSAEGSLVGMEATGHYWVALFDFLAANGFEVAVINPIQTDAWRRVDTVRPAKTDGIDALLIADLLRCKRFEPSALGDEATEGLRQLARYRFELVQELTALKNRATAILDRVFPEYERLFADKFGPTSSALLKECATPADVLAADPEVLAGLLAEASRGRLGRERADEVVEAARSSVGVSFGSRALAFELRVLVERMEFTRGQISELEAEIARALSETAGRHLTSIPGVGPALAALIAGEVGDAARFETPSKLVAYAGMDATRRVSGESLDSPGHLSKRGSSYLRWALMQGADRARRFDPYFGECYARKISQGKHHYVALTTVARKLAAVCLALMKEDRDWSPDPPAGHLPAHLSQKR